MNVRTEKIFWKIGKIKIKGKEKKRRKKKLISKTKEEI